MCWKEVQKRKGAELKTFSFLGNDCVCMVDRGGSLVSCRLQQYCPDSTDHLTCQLLPLLRVHTCALSSSSNPIIGTTCDNSPSFSRCWRLSLGLNQKVKRLNGIAAVHTQKKKTLKTLEFYKGYYSEVHGHTACTIAIHL